MTVPLVGSLICLAGFVWVGFQIQGWGSGGGERLGWLGLPVAFVLVFGMAIEILARAERDGRPTPDPARSSAVRGSVRRILTVLWVLALLSALLLANGILVTRYALP